MSRSMNHRLLGLVCIFAALVLLAFSEFRVLYQASHGAEHIGFYRSQFRQSISGAFLLVPGVALLITGDAMSRETPAGKRDRSVAAIFLVFGLGAAVAIATSFALDARMSALGYTHDRHEFVKLTPFDPTAARRDAAASEAVFKRNSDEIDQKMEEMTAKFEKLRRENH